MNPRDFIQQVFLVELSQIAEKHHFISFSLVGLGTEFLGACLDNYDFEERNLSGLRFRGAVKALYPHLYHPYADLLASHLRNGFAHQFRPGTRLELTKREEAPSKGWIHLEPTADGRICLVAEDLYRDFAEACNCVLRDIDASKLSHPKLRTTYLTT
jgi:hypothetical protein